MWCDGPLLGGGFTRFPVPWRDWPLMLASILAIRECRYSRPRSVHARTYLDTSSSHNATTPSPFLASPIPSPRAAHSISAGWLRLPNFASGPPSSLEPSCVLHATTTTDGKEGRRDKTTAKREKRGTRQWHGQQWSVSCRGAEQARRTDAFEHRRRSRGPGTAPMQL